MNDHPSRLHIFTEHWQPYTRFTFMDELIIHQPRSRYRCHECGDLREARNLEVQAYYDGWRVRCNGGKHPGWV